MRSSGSSPPRPPPPPGTTSSSGPPAVPPPPSSAARVHESSLGDLPTMESAPPSGNFTTTAASLALNLNPLPPPPPPPKSVRMARALSPPRSGNYHSKSPTAVSPLPPPPKVAVTPPAAVATAAATSNQQAAIPAPLPPPPPPPPAVKASSLPSPPSLDNDLPATVDNDELLFPPPRLPLGTFEPALDPHKGPSLLARRQTHIPVLVISTESAQMIAWKNGLQLIDLFQGIARQVHTSNTPFRSINNKSLTLTPAQFQVEFVDPSQLTPCSYSSAHALLQEQAKLQESDGNIAQELELLEDRVELLLQDSTSEDDDVDLRQVTKDAFLLTSPLDIPWLLRYRQALDASTNAMPHDLIACPALVLLVCSTDEVESPVQVLQELYNAPHILPDCFKNGLYDPVVRHEVLVLHDNVEGPPNIDDAALRYTLQQQFGPQSQVLRINNVPKDVALALAAEEDTDIWGGGGTRGTRLSVNDRALLRRYFQTLLTSSLLPALERRIADLNAIVSERKKGVRNLVKNFWRKPKEEIDTTATTTTTFNLQNTTLDDSDNMAMVVLYRHDSIESQTRLLADTLFLIQDYESALATYRLIREDFKSDKALVHYASVQEMMALCMYHLDTYGRARDIFACLELALLSYTRAAEEERKLILGGKDVSARPPTAPHATRLATRLCLLMATASDALTKGRELEVADLLASASSHESSLGAAVLLEQASAFYYEAGMYRKYAFHMLMSGHMFRTANQDHHAFRCFCSALYIYRHGKWAELHNHLKSALAAQLYTMGRMSVAMMLYAKLVEGAGKVSSKSQQKFLTHLLEICLEHPKKALVGADRMAVPPHVSSARERDALRQDRLERMVEIIQYTPGASRVLELPYLNLPKLFDSSVRLWTHAEEHFLPTTTTTSSNNTAEEQQPAFEMAVVDPSKPTAGKTLGKICKGDDEVWDNLELLATAEWNAVDSTVRGLDETVTAALSKIKDTQHRQVIGQIDKEKQSKALMERSRRNGSLKPKAAVRARMEPIFCDFALENPLDVDISITQLQLVARMVDASDTICTNQDAIQIAGGTTDQTWTFPSTEQQEFQVADFCRLSTRNQRACVTATSNPFFVVTKQTLELKAGKKDVVSAGLTPMVEGDLEILGVRYKLSDQVWVYHPFHIPGPLLDDTRSNRANRVRGESLVLKSTISVDMPCVTAELVKRSSSSSTTSSPVVTSDDGGPLLEGQISHWTIRLRNIGSAPASQLIVKTNLPWINIPSKRSGDKVAPEVREGQATSYCIGPTGTLMSLPLEGSHLKVAGTIHPGETVDIPIQIRTSGSGRRHFYMLYRYALYDDESQQSSRTRWLRKMYEVPVRIDCCLYSMVYNAGQSLISIVTVALGFPHSIPYRPGGAVLDEGQ